MGYSFTGISTALAMNCSFYMTIVDAHLNYAQMDGRDDGAEFTAPVTATGQSH